MRRILIPYFNAGLGHISFARAIESGLRRRKPAWEVRLIDAGTEFGGKRLAGLYVESWRRILAQPDFIKSSLFAANGRLPGIFGALNRRAINEALPGLLRLLATFAPDAVIPTHWGCGHLFDAARTESGRAFPIVYLYTELASAYPQIACGADMYFCLTNEADGALRRIGIPLERIRVIDPVVQYELAGRQTNRVDARRSFGLSEERFTVLFSLGGEGIGTAFPFLDHYREHGAHAQILVLTGRNARFLQVLRRRYSERPGRAGIVPVGYLPDLRAAFSAADLFAGKCGTSFAVESIKARRPLLINQSGAPNEADNRDWMVKHGYAAFTPRPADFTAHIETLASSADLYAQALVPFATVTDRNGAEDIVDYLVEKLEPAGGG